MWAAAWDGQSEVVNVSLCHQITETHLFLSFYVEFFFGRWFQVYTNPIKKIFDTNKKVLLNWGASIDARGGKSGGTALMSAAQNGYKATLEVFPK